MKMRKRYNKRKNISLLEKNKDSVMKIITHLTKMLHLDYSQYEEALAVANYALSKAIKNYNPYNKTMASFITFVWTCVKNELLMFIKKENRYNLLNKTDQSKTNMGNDMLLKSIVQDGTTWQEEINEFEDAISILGDEELKDIVRLRILYNIPMKEISFIYNNANRKYKLAIELLRNYYQKLYE